MTKYAGPDQPDNKAASLNIDNDRFFTEKVEEFARKFESTKKELGKIIIGQDQLIEDVLSCMIAGGHALVEGVPGTGKTLLVSSIGKVTGLQTNRIQFTPDKMPADITGTEILDVNDDGKHVLRFDPGPIFTQILLADEINRTPPKTQAALLEAMQEKKVTAGKETRDLSPLFFVLATENPIEQEGTYPLPEAQLDRFLMKINVTYPDRDAEKNIGRKTTGTAVDLKDLYNRMTTEDLTTAPDKDKESPLQQTISPNELFFAQKLARKIIVPEKVWDLIVDLTRKLRPELEINAEKLKEGSLEEFVKSNISYGPGTRAIQSLTLVAKARALMKGNPAVSVQDVLEIAEQVLNHRTSINFRAETQGVKFPQVQKRVLGELNLG